MDSTYDVRIWKIRPVKGKRGTTYAVRWTVAGKLKSKSYATAAQADAFRAELVTAARRGEAFSLTSFLPVSKRAEVAMTWYEFATAFVDAKWAKTSAANRKNIAKALTAATMALQRTAPPASFRPVDVRTALREFAFNPTRRESAGPEVRTILRWVERNSFTMAVWNEPAKVGEVLDVVATKLDGTQAAASSVKRNRRILNVAMEYAVERGVLRANPLPKNRGSTPKTSSAVDKRCLLSPEQAASLLTWCRQRPRGGARLHAFFATLYYTGLRPEEAVALRLRDVSLPEQGWGEIVAHTATPEVGRQWTDSGTVHEVRHLKGRAAGETRVVPCHPALVALLREYVEMRGITARDHVFQGEGGGVLAGSVYRRAWDRARHGVLSPDQYASPLGKRVYDLRHTCLTTWLNNGVPPAQVAEWAGNSVAVLLATYARCVSGQAEDLKKRIEAAQDISGTHRGEL